MTINSAVLVGRFQPFHNGHFFALKTLLTKYDKVVVVIGSHNSLRSLKNPWTADERRNMIWNSLEPTERRKTFIIYQEDRPGNNAKWAKELKAGVDLALWDFHEVHKITLSGYKKDESSFYLDLFPEWEFVPVEPSLIINATDIRRAYFSGNFNNAWGFVPWHSYRELMIFKETNLYKELVSNMEK